MRSVGFFILWLIGSAAAVSVAFAGVAAVDDDLIDPAPAQITSRAVGQPREVEASREAPAATGLSGDEAAFAEVAPTPTPEARTDVGADSIGAEPRGSRVQDPEASMSGTATPQPEVTATTTPNRLSTGQATAAPVPESTRPAAVVAAAEPTATSAPATQTDAVVPSATPVPVPTAATAPVPTTVPATPTVPPTAIPVPPTAVPPTATPVPPTATPIPPTATSVPPTATPVPPPSPTAQPATQVLTFNLVGGSTAISFSPSGIDVLWATPHPGFEVEIDPEESDVRVEFESDEHRSRIDAWWSDGPQHEIREDD